MGDRNDECSSLPFSSCGHAKNTDFSACLWYEDMRAIVSFACFCLLFFARAIKGEEEQQDAQVETELPSADLCAENPCKNNGTCFAVDFANDVACLCAPRWTGKFCETANVCLLNPCLNGGTCELDGNGDQTYSCDCPQGYVGQHCERFCPSYLCANGGTCVLDEQSRKFRCECGPGFTGDHCDREIDECQSNPCLNGGVCKDRKMGFKCICQDGWMGERCQRPCRDIYKSCKLWRSEDRCTWARTVTRFFDVNCGESCSKCISSNDTGDFLDIPLPPVLEPLDFILGTWETMVLDTLKYPIDFTTATKGYREVLRLMTAEVPMFGTPSINYTAKSVNIDDSDDEQRTVGFLTLKPGSKPLRVYLLSTDNNGVTTIEEGHWQNETLLLDTTYAEGMPQADSSLPRSAQRAFRLRGRQLQVTVLKYDHAGNFYYFNRLYSKVV